MQHLSIFLINLDVQPERHSYMMAAFGALELEFTRVSAMDGSVLTPDILKAFASRQVGYRWALGEIGCLLSHGSVWKRMVDENIPVAAIFEDDVRISRQLPAFLAQAGNLPADTHVVKLETMGTPADIDQTAAREFGPIRVSRLRSKHLGSAGYLLTLAGAKALLDVTRVPARPVDHHLFDPYLPGHRHLVVYQALPALVVQRGREPGQNDVHSMFSSAIDSNNVSRHQKLVPLGEKVRRELRRPFLQLTLATRRLVCRWRYGASTIAVPFEGDGVLDDYIASMSQKARFPADILARLGDDTR